MPVVGLLGWPALLLAAALAIFGNLKGRSSALAYGALLTLPAALVSREHAGFRTIGFFLPAFHLASAFALSKGHRSLAWAIITPFVGFLFWLGAVVVSQ